MFELRLRPKQQIPAEVYQDVLRQTLAYMDVMADNAASKGHQTVSVTQLRDLSEWAKHRLIVRSVPTKDVHHEIRA